MKQQEAIDLIRKGIPKNAIPQLRADVACGSGTFTGALAHLLPKGSHVYAIDSMEHYLPRSLGDTVSVSFVKADFEQANFNFSNFDGILMANALHYIKNKQLLIDRLAKYLSADKKLSS